MDMFSLEGKNALVVGGSKGIGRGIARALARAGANIVVSTRNEEDCIKCASEITADYGVRAFGIPGDISTVDRVNALVNSTIDKLEHIDILVNSAGVNIRKPSLTYTESEWDYVQNVQLKGVFFTCQAVVKHMVEKGIHGRIINVTSDNAIVVARPDIVSYVAAKAGVMQMTKALAVEWAPYHITVNAIAPGWFKTDLTKAVFEDEAAVEKMLNHIPEGRFGNPEQDIGGIAVYFASDEAPYTTGQMISIDGGYTCI